MGKLEDCPEEVTPGSHRMNRSWLGRKVRLWVEVGMGRNIQKEGCQVISGNFMMSEELLHCKGSQGKDCSFPIDGQIYWAFLVPELE